jgi:hypothetical protein
MQTYITIGLLLTALPLGWLAMSVFAGALGQ